MRDQPFIVAALEQLARIQVDGAGRVRGIRSRTFQSRDVEFQRHSRIERDEFVVGLEPAVSRYLVKRPVDAMEMTSQVRTGIDFRVVRPKLIRELVSRDRPVAAEEQIGEQRHRSRGHEPYRLSIVRNLRSSEKPNAQRSNAF
jgi:hypothetical protein